MSAMRGSHTCISPVMAFCCIPGVVLLSRRFYKQAIGWRVKQSNAEFTRQEKTDVRG